LLLEYKDELNSLFYKTYYRYIAEGTWTDNEAINDETYYIKSLAVMRNSCYPKATYSINILELSALPGYE
jgi:hypothetical protein